MSIRAAISGLLAGEGELADAATALEEAGYDNVPAEAFGTALTHFSDTATLDEADALAPVVTRTGPISFEESDLPGIDFDVESEDAFTLFGNTVTPVHQDFGESDLDEIDEPDGEPAPQSRGEIEHLDEADEADFDFGKPSSHQNAQDALDDSPNELSPELSEQTFVFDDTEQMQALDEDIEPEPIDDLADFAEDESDDSDDPFDDELEIDL